MTRDSDTYPTLTERVELANNQGADAFISIHSNAYPDNPDVNGTETYYDDSYATQKSYELAASIQRELLKRLDTTNRGVRNNNYKVIRETTMPSVLVELGFVNQ